MRRIEVPLRAVDGDKLKKRVAASPEHVTMVVDEPAEVYHDGKLQMVHLLPGDNMVPLLDVMKRIRFDQGFRTMGLKTTSRVFGYQPRLTVRRDFCTEASIVRDDPAASDVLKHYARLASDHIKQWNPSIHALHEKTLGEKVRPEWRIKDSIFTSGIANWDNQLRYHFDTGNFVDLWSAMYVLKRDIEGGDLVVPAFDARLKFQNGSLLLFNAQQFLHGVTPIKKMNTNAYRYTIVFYTLRGLCNCGSPAEELERIQKVKLTREYKRAGMPIGNLEDEQ